MLKLESVRAGYGAVEVLRGISLDVAEGEIVAMIGANGAGKTTMLMAICGLVPVRSGRISFRGEDVTRRRACELVGLGLAQAPEGRKIFPRLTVLENLEMGAYCRQDPEGQRADLERVFEMFPLLRQRRQQAGGTLSGGEQQMLAVARALMARPRLLVLDEPSLGLAPLIVHRIFEVIGELNRSGVTILLVEQNARMALKVSHRAYVMETGSIQMSGKASDLLADSGIRSAYLGE